MLPFAAMNQRSFRCLSAATIAAVLALVPVSAGVGDDPRVRQAITMLEIWLDAQRDFDQIPGLSAAVIHDQVVVWNGAYGFADREKKLPAAPNTIYSICSISKVFTSIAVMQQRDAGKLRLDDPVARHLPWFSIKRTDPDAPEITIESLLTHSSGLPREAAFAYWTAPDFTFPTREQMIEKLKGQETYHASQSYHQYSNLALTLAGEIAANAAGEPYAEYMRKRVLDPIGLSDTTTSMLEGEAKGRLAVGYTSIQRTGTRDRVPRFAAKGIDPAAGFASTVEDLAKFASWQFRVLARKEEQHVLSTNTLREMQRVHWMDPDFGSPWGLGFTVWRDSNKTFVGHGGSCPGFRAQLTMNTAERVAVIVMANAQGVNTGNLALQAYHIVGPQLKAAADRSSKGAEEKPKTPPASYERYKGTYATGFAGEVAFVPWKDGLASFGLPTADPMGGLTEWKKAEGEHAFRRVRKDESLAETIVFQVGPDGRVSGLTWHNNNYRRVK